MEKDSYCLVCLQKPHSNSNLFSKQKNLVNDNDDFGTKDKSLLLPFVVECFVDNVDLECVRLISNLNTNNHSSLFCSACMDVILNTFKVHKQVLQLQKNLNVLKDKLRQRLEVSCVYPTGHLSDEYVQLRKICTASLQQTSDEFDIKIETTEPVNYESDENFDVNDADGIRDPGDQIEPRFENVDVYKKCISPDYIQIPEKITQKSSRTRAKKRKLVYYCHKEDDDTPLSDDDITDPDFLVGGSDSNIPNKESSENDSEPDVGTTRTTRTNPVNNSLKCNTCGIVSSTSKAFRAHQALHITKKDSSCDICKFPCANQTTLASHYAIQHPSSPLPINILVKKEKSSRKKISRKNSTQFKLVRKLPHVNKPKEPVGPIICEVCGAIFKIEGTYKAHMSIYHASSINDDRTSKKRVEREECPTCHKMCVKNSMANHMKLHERNITCEICSFKVTTWQGLKIHFALKHPGKHPTNVPAGEYRWKCLKCNFTAYSYNQKQKHNIKHAPPEYIEMTEAGTFCCKLCSEVFSTETKISTHIRLKHAQQIRQADLTCSECGEVLGSKLKLRRHANLVHKQKQFQCDQCGVGFQDKIVFEDHVAKHENPNVETKCDICGLSFSNRKVVMIHKYGYHRNELVQKSKKPRKNASKKGDNRRQTCVECGVECCNLRAIRMHMREAHPELYKFKCNICSLTFSVVHRLNEHVKLIHESVKAKCSQCDVVFNNERGVKQHILRGTCKKTKVEYKIKTDADVN